MWLLNSSNKIKATRIFHWFLHPHIVIMTPNSSHGIHTTLTHSDEKWQSKSVGRYSIELYYLYELGMYVLECLAE